VTANDKPEEPERPAGPAWMPPTEAEKAAAEARRREIARRNTIYGY